MRVAGCPQNSPMRSPRSKSGSSRTWRSSVRAGPEGVEAVSESALRPPCLQSRRCGILIPEAKGWCDDVQAKLPLSSHLTMMVTGSARPIPATFGHARSEPLRVAVPDGFLGDPSWQVRTAIHRHTTSSAAVSLGPIGLRANERRCNRFKLVSRPEMEGTDESE